MMPAPVTGILGGGVMTREFLFVFCLWPVVETTEHAMG